LRKKILAFKTLIDKGKPMNDPVFSFSLNNYTEATLEDQRIEQETLWIRMLLPKGIITEFITKEIEHRQKLGMSKLSALRSVKDDLTNGRL
jgi:hypothetical protein